MSDKVCSYLSIAQEKQKNGKVLLEIPLNTQRKTVFETKKPSFSPLVGSSRYNNNNNNNDKENQNFV